MCIKIMYETVHNSSFVINCVLFNKTRSKKYVGTVPIWIIACGVEIEII